MKYFYFIIFFLLINCNLNNVEEIHGISNLKNKLKNININSSNQNDVINILGEPLLKDSYNKSIWSYVEVRKKTNFYGSKTLVLNDVVILKFNSNGVLDYLKTYDLNDIKKIDFNQDITQSNAVDHSFLKNLLASSKKRWDMTRDKLKSQ